LQFGPVFAVNRAMGISQIISVAALTLAGLLPASCHKTSPQQKNTPPAALAMATTGTKPVDVLHNLGDVMLTNHYETCVQLGGGKNCLLTPKMLDKHNVQITMAIESKTAAGKTQDLSVTQVVTRTDRPLEVAVGDFALSFTPHLN